MKKTIEGKGPSDACVDQFGRSKNVVLSRDQMENTAGEPDGMIDIFHNWL